MSLPACQMDIDLDHVLFVHIVGCRVMLFTDVTNSMDILQGIKHHLLSFMDSSQSKQYHGSGKAYQGNTQYSHSNGYNNSQASVPQNGSYQGNKSGGVQQMKQIVACVDSQPAQSSMVANVITTSLAVKDHFHQVSTALAQLSVDQIQQLATQLTVGQSQSSLPTITNQEGVSHSTTSTGNFQHFLNSVIKEPCLTFTACIIDYGATSHVCCNLSMFTTINNVSDILVTLRMVLTSLSLNPEQFKSQKSFFFVMFLLCLPFI